MTTRVLILIAAALAAVAAGSVSAHTITVDCQGLGDFEDLPLAVWAGDESDTVLVEPCVYHVGSFGWPIQLSADSPTIVGREGAEVTILQGTGTQSAFVIGRGFRACIKGLTFRNLEHVIDRGKGDRAGFVHFTENVIEYCGEGLNASNLLDTSVVSDNVIIYCDGYGIYMYHNSGIISGNEVCYNVCGITGSCCETPTIQGNHVHHNSAVGIHTVFYANVTENIIEYNGLGIFTESTGYSNVFANNIIRFNAGATYYPGGVFFGGYGPMQFYHNDVYGNEPHNFACDEYSSACVIDATMNWWGTTNPHEIAAGIYDCSDDPGIDACVVFDPWCACPGCEPTIVKPATWGSIKSLYR